MKKNILLVATMALMTAVTISLHAQPPAGGPPPGQQGAPPNFRQGGPPGMRGRPGMTYRQASLFLKRAKADLERSTEDYDGHRQTAIDACDKAIHELDAVQKSIMDTQRAKAAAAAAAAQQNAQPAPAAAPSSTPPPQ